MPGIQQSYLGDLPISTVKPFRGAKDTLALMTKSALGDQGERSSLVKAFTEWTIRDVLGKSYDSEINAVRNVFVQRSPWKPWLPLIHYSNDPRHVEVVKTPERMVREIASTGSTQADCDEIAMLAGTMCLILGREVEWVALGFDDGGGLSHVATRVKEPKSGRWVFLDGVAGPKEAEALRKAKSVLFWSLD